MKQGKFLKMIILTALLTAYLCLDIFAAEEVGRHSTNVDIGFVASTEIIPPVLPEEPETPSGETGTNMEGPLSLDWVPTLNFGTSHAVSPTAKTYNNTTHQPYIQISDLRGTGGGWAVYASLSTFHHNEGDVESLPGAFIMLKNGRTNTATIGIEPPIPDNSVRLDSDGENDKVVTAPSALQAGRGTWVVRWYPHGLVKDEDNTDLQLTVPAAAAAIGTHTATITWILYDAP